MIFATDKQRHEFIEEYRARVEPDPAAQLTETVSDTSFPGALLALPRQNGTTYLAFADDRQQWRKLAPLLQAAVGPPISSFTSVPSSLRPADPFERWIDAFGVGVIGRIEPFSAQRAHDALTRLVKLVAQIPPTATLAPRSTGLLLREFDTAIAARDEANARTVLNNLKDERRLDTANLRFLQVQLDARTGQWERLRRMSWFDDLASIPHPPMVSAAQLEAIAVVDRLPSELTEAREWYRRSVARFAGDLFGRYAPGSSPVVSLLYALFWYDEPARQEWTALEAAAAYWSTADRALLTSWLPRSVRSIPPADVPDPISLARAALIDAERDTSLETCDRAIAAVAALGDADRTRLFAQPRLSELWETLVELVGKHVPQSWPDLLRQLPQLTPHQARSLAERGKDSWRAADAFEHPDAVRAFVDAFTGVPNSGQAALDDILGSLVAWLAADPAWPRRAAQPLYQEVLTRLILSDRLAGATWSTIVLLTDGLLTLEPDRRTYADWLAELAGAVDRLSAMDLTTLLELFESILVQPCPDREARLTCNAAIVGRLLAWWRDLNGWKRHLAETLIGIAQIDTHLPAEPVVENEGIDPLVNQRIVIYTLETAAGARARDSLMAASRSADVRLFSDQVATRQLTQAVQQADLVVVSWRAATHAATLAIEAARPHDCRLVHASGKGSASILAAIDAAFNGG